MPRVAQVSRRQFDKSIRSLAKLRTYDTSAYIPRVKYDKLLAQVKLAKSSESGGWKSAKLLKTYDIDTLGGVERLVTANSTTNKLIYLASDELFDVISASHGTSHSRLSPVMKQLRGKYKNVTNEAVNAYVKLCRSCSTRERHPRRCKKDETDDSKENQETAVSSVGKTRKSAKSKPSACRKLKDGNGPKRTLDSGFSKPHTAALRTPQRLDVIAMDGHDDNNYILVVRESTTKFVHLRPLKCVAPQQLVEAMHPIFQLFGTPSLLVTSSVSCLSDVLDELHHRHPTVPRDIELQETEETPFVSDIEHLMLSWMSEHGNSCWANGLKFVQYIANLRFDGEVGKSPFEAMFGRKGKLDVNSLPGFLHGELAQDLRPAEDSQQVRDIDVSNMLEVVYNNED